MLASAQMVLHRVAEPIVAPAGFTAEGCGMGRLRSTGSVLEEYGILIVDAKVGVVEADHYE